MMERVQSHAPSLMWTGPPPAVTLPWQALLRRRGWLGLHWPREHGGAGLNALQTFQTNILDRKGLQSPGRMGGYPQRKRAAKRAEIAKLEIQLCHVGKIRRYSAVNPNSASSH